MAMDFGQTIRLGRHSRNPFRRQPVSAADDVDLQSAYIKNIDIYAAPIPTLQSDQQQNRMAQRKQERHDSGCFDMTASSTGSSSPLLDLASSAEGRQDFSRSEIQPLSPRRQNGNVRARHQHPSTADLIHSAHLCHGEPQKLSMRDLRKQEYSRHEPTKSITRKPVHIGSCAQNHDLVPAPLTMPGTSALNKFHAAVARYKQLSTYTSEEDFEGCKPYMPSPAASYVRPQLQVPHGGLEYHPFSTVNDDVTGRFDYADDHEDVSDPFSSVYILYSWRLLLTMRMQ